MVLSVEPAKSATMPPAATRQLIARARSAAGTAVVVSVVSAPKRVPAKRVFAISHVTTVSKGPFGAWALSSGLVVQLRMSAGCGPLT